MLTFVSFTAFAIYLHSCLFTLIHFRGSPNSQSVLDLKDEIIFRGKICKIYQSSENNHSMFMKEKKKLRAQGKNTEMGNKQHHHLQRRALRI